MKFEDIRIVFIVGTKHKETFSEWLVSLGIEWFGRDFEDLKERLKERSVLVIEDNDVRLSRFIDQLNNSPNPKVIWFIGCNWVLGEMNPFNNFFYNTRSEWELFKKQNPQAYESLNTTETTV